MDRHIAVTVHLTTSEAEALARFLKGVSSDDFARHAANHAEADLMRSAGAAIQRGLREQGYALR